MGHTTIRTRENRTLTIDFRDEATYCRLIGDGKAFVAWVLAFVLTLGFQLKHRATCRGGGCLTRHCVDHVTATAGPANGERVRRWFQAKKAGWYAVLTDPQMPMTSTLLNQAHNTVERKLFAMKGFHHPGGSQRAFLTGLAHLYNLVPYQRRAQHAGQGEIEVEGGRLPTADWFFNLQILTSGGFR
jgi:hypothetical protein